MASLLSDKYPRHTIKVSQSTGDPTQKVINQIDQLLLILPEKPPAAVWKKIPQGTKVRALLDRRPAGSVPAIVTRMSNGRQTALYVGKLDASGAAFEQLEFARKLTSAALGEQAGNVAVWVLGFGADEQEAIASHALSALLAAGFPLPRFKSKDKPPVLESLLLIGLERRLDTTRLAAEAEGNNLARWLTAMPPNVLNAQAYTALLRELARQQGWQYKRFGTAELAKLGAGAFLAVAQGNADDSAAIVRLRYRPGKGSADPELTLVGKGIIFDTGGNNLKPFQSMLEMHIDMGGSAVAVGVLRCMTELRLPIAVDCWLAVTENRIGPTAYKSQDVITAANGKTVQTIHTDAEGRFALADTLVLACRDRPGLIIDYATLTGACINAISNRYSGVFTNRPGWHPVLKKTGLACGERVWPFPIGKEYLEDLKSDTADLKQCAPSASGDHILAATFLNEFVDKQVPWIHIDLSACLRKGGLAHVPTDVTGFGVRYTMSLILDRDVLGNADWKQSTSA